MKKAKPYLISRRLRMILITQAMLLLGAYILLFSAYTKLNRHNSDTAINQLNYTIQSNMRHTLNTLDVSTKFPISHTAVKYRKDELWSYLHNQEKIKENPGDFNRVFDDRSAQTLFQFPSLDSIFLLNMKGNTLAYTRSDMFSRPFTHSGDYSWLDKTIKLKGKLVILSHTEAQELGYAPSNILYATRMLSSTNTLKPLCIILNGIRLDDLAADFGSQRLYNDQQFALFRKDGSFLYTSGTISETLLSSGSVSAQTNVSSNTLDGINYTYHLDYDDTLEIYSIIRTPTSELNKNNQNFYLLFWLLIPLILISNLLIFGHLVHRISSPLEKLVTSCNKVGEGDFSVRINNDSSDELGYVTSSFNLMSQQVEKLVNEVYLRNITEQDLELQMLRSQINPHFLYNTLESMRMSAYSKGYTEQSEMCRLLAKILRYGVASKNHMVTVREELEHLKDYAALLRYRFYDQIQVTVQVAEDMMDLMIIKLILQPLVENCFNHGIIGMDSVGYIQVWGYRQEQNIIFVVTDNGAGMDEETLLLLQQYLAGENQAFTSIGLKNIHRRIQLYYGKEYGLTINSKPGKGTSVTILLPQNNSNNDTCLPNGRNEKPI